MSWTNRLKSETTTGLKEEKNGWKSRREREKTKMRKEIHLESGSAVFGQIDGDPVLFSSIILCIFSIIASIFYCICILLCSIYPILYIYSVFLCTEYDAVLSVCSAFLFDTNNTIREPLYRTVWYLSTAPLPLAGSTPIFVQWEVIIS